MSDNERPAGDAIQIAQRVGVVAGLLAEHYPDHRIRTRQTLAGQATIFEVSTADGRNVVDYTVSHTQLTAIRNVHNVVASIIDAASRRLLGRHDDDV